jgi:hypothetical protein
VNEDSERSAPIDERVSNETQPKEDEAPQESSIVEQEAVAEEKESNETEPKVEAPQEPCVTDQQAVEEARLNSEEQASLKSEEHAGLIAENIRKAEEQVATKKNSNLSFGKFQVVQ